MSAVDLLFNFILVYFYMVIPFNCMFSGTKRCTVYSLELHNCVEILPLCTFLCQDVYDASDQRLSSLGTRFDQLEQLWGIHTHVSNGALQQAKDGTLGFVDCLDVHHC